MDPTVTRRTVLVVGAAGAGAVALAACGSSSGSRDSTGSTGAGASTAAAGNTPLARLSDITVGQAVSVKLQDGSAAILARPTQSTAACFSAKCTHMGCTVQPAGAELHCPCHGSVYDAVTGAVKQGPAPKALSKIDVHVVEGEVLPG